MGGGCCLLHYFNDQALVVQTLDGAILLGKQFLYTVDNRFVQWTRYTNFFSSVLVNQRLRFDEYLSGLLFSVLLLSQVFYPVI